MKISWIVIVAIVAFVLFRKQIAGALNSLMVKPSSQDDDGSSASTSSPLDNLISDQQTGSKAKDLLSQMVDKLQTAKQDYLAEDLIEDPANLSHDGVSQADFITTLRSQEDKIFAVPNPAAFQAKGLDPSAPKRKQDQSWWPNVLYNLNPSWN